MAHNLEIKNGKASFAYSGNTPWHNLGTKLANPFTAAEALTEARLDWSVEKTPVAVADSGKVIPGQFAVRRSDNQDVLGIVGNYYQPLQNRDAFAFFDGVFGKDAARFECAGVLGQGERVWMLAKLPGDFVVQGDDVIGKYLLLTNNHDGTETVRARFTPIRVVCQNTLNAALHEKGRQISVYHMGDPKRKLELAGRLLKEAGIYFDEAQDTFRRFASFKVNQDTRRQYWIQSVTQENTSYADLAKITRGSIDKIEELHETGKGSELPNTRGTLWGAYNAITEFVDHIKTGEVDSGLTYMAAGRGARIKARAFADAQSLMLATN